MKISNYSRKHPAKRHPLFRVSRGTFWKVERIFQITLPKSQIISQLISRSTRKFSSKIYLLFARKVPSWLIGRRTEKFSKVPSYKSEKFSQLVSEGVKKQPFSLATYWGNCLPVYLENWIAASKGYASGKWRHDFPIIQGSRKIEDFVGRGAAVKRMSFRTSAEANDIILHCLQL